MERKIKQVSDNVILEEPVESPSLYKCNKDYLELLTTIGLGKGSRSEHPLPDCQGSHDVSWLHSDREKDCGLKIPLTSTANF